MNEGKPTKSEAILIVEDSPTQREQLRYILECEGYRVEAAVSGEDALEKLKEIQPALIISDVNMPGIDGFELCRRYKLESRGDDAPFMLLTSMSDPIDVIRGLESGADSFTVKPYEHQTLLSRVSYMLANCQIHGSDSSKMGVEIRFANRTFFISSDRLQILNLLLSTYETAVQKNRELLDAQKELRDWNSQLESKVEERTRELQAEVNERRKVEKVLRLEQENRIVALEAVDAVLFRQDQALRYTWIYCSKTTHEAMAVVGKTDYDLVPPEDLNPIVELKQQVLKEQKSARGFIVIHRDGEPNYYDLVASPLRDESEDVVGITGALLNVTERYSAEQAKKRSESLLGGVMESAPDGILIVDNAFRIHVANPAGAKMFGYEPEALTDICLDTLIPDFADVANKNRESGDAHDLVVLVGANSEREATRKDGTTFPVEIKASPLGNDYGPFSLVLVEDLTDARGIQEQLHQSQKMDAVGQLTGGIAHDFNNLLGVILGNLDLLEEQCEGDPGAIKRVATAQKAAERGADLTRRLLSFSRKQQLKTEPTLLNECIENLLVMARRTLGAEIEIDVDLQVTQPILTEPAALENAILNLMINARDAMAGGGKVRISTRVVDLSEEYSAVRAGELEPGRYACISVEDDGQGMDKATLQKALEPFFTTKPRGKGTGLGLPMVYGLVKQSGGHMNIYSEVGFGTRIKMYFPLSGEETSIVESRPMPEHAPVAGKTVLVVDDEPDLLEVAVSYLKGMGFEVLQANNGPEAMALISNTPAAVDLLVTDIVMPGGMNGVELSNNLRAIRPDLKVVFSSGFSSSALCERNGIAPKGEVLSKPYRKQEFIGTIGRALV